DLCPSPATRTDTPSYRDTRDLLMRSSIEPRLLCAIEAAIAKSQRLCPTSRKDGSSALMLQLFRMVASHWDKERNFPKADGLYCPAYREAIEDGSVLTNISVLQDWAFLMVQLEETESAKEFVLQQVAIAREEDQSDRSSRFGTNALINALKFQAEMFERLNL